MAIVFPFFSCFSGKPLDSSKSNSYFVIAGKYYYIQNGNSIALGKHIIPNVKGELVVLDENFAKDDQQIFYKYIPQPQVNYNSFNIIKKVIKDKHAVFYPVYHSLKMVVDADPESFRYLEIDTADVTRWSCDRNTYYLNHRPVKVDYKTFFVLNLQLAFDKHTIYTTRKNELQTQALAQGAVTKLTSFFCRDDKNVYFYSFRTGFQKHVIAHKDVITIVSEREIKVKDSLLTLF